MNTLWKVSAVGFLDVQDPGGAWEERERQRGDHTVPANASIIDLVLSVAEAAAETSLEGGNMALAIFIPVLIISLLLGGAYIYLTRCRYYSSLRLPLMYSHPYSQITVETEFDNPIYETGETREYEVSI